MKYPCAVTMRFTDAQYEAVKIVARANNIDPATLFRNLVEFHVVPIAAKQGYRKYLSKQISEIAANIDDLVPKAIRKLTQSQLMALMELCIEGCNFDDLAELYEVDVEGVKELLEGKSRDELSKLQKILRKAVKKETA